MPTATKEAPAPVAMPVIPFASMFSKPTEVGPPKSILFFAMPGRWKTSLAGQLILLPQFTKILYIDCDNGTEVLANFPEVFKTIGDDFGQPGEKRINIVSIDKTDPNAYGMLKYLLGARNEQGVFVRGAAFNQGYDAIVLDTADIAQQIGVQWLTNNTFNDRGALNTQAAWGIVGEWTSDVFWALQNGKEVGITLAHSKEEADKNGKVMTKPQFQGGTKDTIAGIPSLVAYADFQKHNDVVSLVAEVGQSDSTTTKNRYSITEPIVDFSFAKLYSIIAERDAATAATNGAATTTKEVSA